MIPTGSGLAWPFSSSWWPRESLGAGRLKNKNPVSWMVWGVVFNVQPSFDAFEMGFFNDLSTLEVPSVSRSPRPRKKKKDLPWNTSLRKHFCTSFVACSRNPTSAIQKHHRSSFLKSSRCKGPLNVCPLPKSPLNDVFISHLLQLNHLLIWGTHIGVCLSISIVKSQYIYTMNVDMTMCIHFFWPFHVCFLCSVLHFSHSAVWTAYTTCRPTCFYTE